MVTGHHFPWNVVAGTLFLSDISLKRQPMSGRNPTDDRQGRDGSHSWKRRTAFQKGNRKRDRRCLYVTWKLLFSRICAFPNSSLVANILRLIAQLESARLPFMSWNVTTCCKMTSRSTLKGADYGRGGTASSLTHDRLEVEIAMNSGDDLWTISKFRLTVSRDRIPYRGWRIGAIHAEEWKFLDRRKLISHFPPSGVNTRPSILVLTAIVQKELQKKKLRRRQLDSTPRYLSWLFLCYEYCGWFQRGITKYPVVTQKISAKAKESNNVLETEALTPGHLEIDKNFESKIFFDCCYTCTLFFSV